MTRISLFSPSSRASLTLASRVPWVSLIRQQTTPGRKWASSRQHRRLVLKPEAIAASWQVAFPVERRSTETGILLHLDVTELRSIYLLTAPASLRLLLRWPPGARATERA